mmetsp:Transcript_65392/g.132766  ORF Transcript_65392/g.132766 Transcript_65392/m.132766 type:complete len:206 (-) Transcript_65392:52-669(-)
MSILEYNGAAIIAMCGKGCVGIAADTRLGVQHTTVATDFKKVFQLNDRLFLGLAGLATDVQTVHELVTFRMNMYKLKEEREMKASTFSHLMESMLYGRRFAPWFVEPVIAGLEGDDNTPFVYASDLLGAGMRTDDFVVSGTCTENMAGMCESLYKKNMGPDELFEVLAQCLLASVDRDAMSGWGGVVHIITPTEIITRTLKGRQD